MKPQDIKPTDWQRIFMGDVPPEFYIELAIRAMFIFLLLTVCMRMIGKRMTAHVNQLELVALVSLASSIGIPLLAPDRGLVPSTMIAFMITGITIFISKISYKNEKFRKFTQGKFDIIINNGVINIDILEKVRITHEELFGHLRSQNIYHLGQVKRVYFETNGKFTVIKNNSAEPGLLVLPEFDKEFIDSKLVSSNISICKSCGSIKENKHDGIYSGPVCNNCGNSNWGNAVVKKENCY